MSLIIAVPRECRTSERRVALDPSRVERLLQSGARVQIEAECGHSASFHDEDYHGATVMDSFEEVVSGVDIVVKVVCPTLEEIEWLPTHCVLVCIMSAFQHVEELKALRNRQITVLAMDHLPRTTRAQPMDALSSQATVAGYKAALLAAELSPRLFPMLTTAAGTIRPSRVLVIGAGVAGLQAIATSRRLGAQVEAYDIRRAAKEQIESLGARMVDTGVEVEGAGGFARALRKDEKKKQHDVLAKHLSQAHVVICAAAIPGREAPRIITEDMVDGMLPESVIVDMAASTGGNCELTRIGEHYYHHETLIVGPLNLPSHGAVHASEMYARNIHNMLQLVICEGAVVLDPEDDIIARCMLLHDGRITDVSIAKLLEDDMVEFSEVVKAQVELPDQSAGWLSDESNDTANNVSGSVQASVQTDQSGDSTYADAASDVGNISDTQAVEAVSTVVASASSSAVPVLDNTANQAIQTNDDTAAVDTAAVETSDVEGVAAITLDNELSSLDALEDEQALSDLKRLDGVEVQDLDNMAELDDEDFIRADDLTLIDGVGPALQERLYAFGFRQMSQLAQLDSEGVQKLAIQLELGDEIEEQNWVEQAQRLREAGE